MKRSSFVLLAGAGMRAAACCSAAVLVLAAAGCASTNQAQREEAAIRAANAAMAARERAPEVEDDGLPAQVAPRYRPAPERDDPREPFSPNYGRGSNAQRVGGATPEHAFGAQGGKAASSAPLPARARGQTI